MLWDQRLKGFGVRIEPSGTKTYLIRYRAGGGRRGVLRQFKIGTHGKLTPDMARKEAGQRLAEAELGGDPQAKRGVRFGLREPHRAGSRHYLDASLRPRPPSTSPHYEPAPRQAAEPAVSLLG